MTDSLSESPTDHRRATELFILSHQYWLSTKGAGLPDESELEDAVLQAQKSGHPAVTIGGELAVVHTDTESGPVNLTIAVRRDEATGDGRLLQTGSSGTLIVSTLGGVVEGFEIPLAAGGKYRLNLEKTTMRDVNNAAVSHQVMEWHMLTLIELASSSPGGEYGGQGRSGRR